MKRCINCDKKTKDEIWVGYPMCKECFSSFDNLSLFQLFDMCGEKGTIWFLEKIKNGKVKVPKKYGKGIINFTSGKVDITIK